MKKIDQETKKKICLDFWDTLLGNTSTNGAEQLKNATNAAVKTILKSLSPPKGKTQSVYYRVYLKKRLNEVLETGVIPKMQRRGITLLEDDAVFLAPTINDAMILSPDAVSLRAKSNFYNTPSVKSFLEFCCSHFPESCSLVERDTTMYALMIKANWIDTALLIERDNIKNTKEYLYPQEIIIPEPPVVLPVRSIPGFYELICHVNS